MSKLDMGPSANPNDNYNILSDVITAAKANHIPKKLKKIDRRKFKKQPWMTDQVLKLAGEAPKQKFSHMYLIIVALVRN